MPIGIAQAQICTDGIAHEIVREKTAVGQANERQALKPIIKGFGILAGQQFVQQRRRKCLNHRRGLKGAGLFFVQRLLNEFEHQILQFTPSTMQIKGFGAHALADIRSEGQYQRISLGGLPERLPGADVHAAPGEIGVCFAAVETGQFEDLHQVDPAKIGPPARAGWLASRKDKANGRIELRHKRIAKPVFDRRQMFESIDDQEWRLLCGCIIETRQRLPSSFRKSVRGRLEIACVQPCYGTPTVAGTCFNLR